MKITLFLSASLLFFSATSCFNFKSETDEEFGTAEATYNSEADYPESKKTMAKNDEKMVFKNIVDPQRNMVSSRMPLPKSWNLVPQNQQGLFIEAPGNVKVHTMKYHSFLFTQDPYMQQMYAQTGTQLRPMPNIEQIFQQDIFPLVSKEGFTVKKQYPLQKIAQLDRQYMNQLYQSAPSQKSFDVLAVELENSNNKSSLVLLKAMRTFSQGLSIWGYHGYVLEAPTKNFEKSKEIFLNALHNIEYNPQHIAAYNQSEQQKESASWARHNQKMASNQRNFEASQRAFRESNEAINNSMMQTWRSQNASSDRMQEQLIDGIWERSNMTDPGTGQSYKVDGGYNNYWINGNGEYIPTDDQFYNPNTDPNVNNQNWEQMTPTDDGGW